VSTADIKPGFLLLTKCSFEATHINLDIKDQNKLVPSKRTTIKIIRIPKGVNLLAVEVIPTELYQQYPNLADFIPRFQLIFLYNEKLCHAASVIGWSDYFDVILETNKQQDTTNK